MDLKSQLAPLYHRLLPTSILQMDPTETLATCDNCLMSQPAAQKTKEWYQPDLKCCTYYPFLPNYVIGNLLEESPEFVKKRLHDVIDQQKYALPIGVVAPISYQVEFNNRTLGEFGQRRDWLCPYYDQSSNRCGVWLHRGSVCTTYYCKSNYKARGKKYWQLLGDYLSYVEMALMEEALVQLDFSPRQVSELVSFLNCYSGTEEELQSDRLSPAVAKSLWNGYYEEQPHFYQRCSEIVQNLALRDFKELLGPQGQSLEKDLRTSYKNLKPEGRTK